MFAHRPSSPTGAVTATTHPRASRRLRRVVVATLAVTAVATGLLVQSNEPGAEAATNEPIPSTESVQSTEYGIWSDETVPRLAADPETQSVTLGVQFTSTTDGWVHAIRFYRSAENLGPHEGTLWSTSGAVLARAMFPSSTSVGWQTARLVSPVRVSKDTVYTASYRATRGRYAGDTGTLSPRRRVTNGALTAHRGVYTYGPGIPSSTWRNSNYYVDVLFSTTVPVTTVPVTTVPATTVPVTTVPVTTVPVTTVPVTTVPVTTVPVTTVPVTTVPATTVPATTVAPTTVPATTVPATTVAPTTVPATTAPPAVTTTVPVATIPPSTTTVVPPVTSPATTIPATTIPATTVPASTTTTIPATTIPATTIPATTVPATTVPATTVPATTVPATTIPATTVPATTTTTVPATTIPATTVPATTTTVVTPAVELPGSPADIAQGFSVFVRGAAHLVGGNNFSSAAIGGDLTFATTKYRMATVSAGSFQMQGAVSPTALYVGRIVNWDNSEKQMWVENGMIHIVDPSNVEIQPGNSNQTILSKVNEPSSPKIRLTSMNQNGGFMPTTLIDFTSAFSELDDLSDLLASAAARDDVELGQLRGNNGNGVWTGSGSVWMYFHPGSMNVLNVTTAQLNAMGRNINFAPGSAVPSAENPLVINVTNPGTVTFSPDDFTQSFASSVIWNFPNATHVTINSATWGSVLAPNATVVQNADVRGDVYADMYLSLAGVVDNAHGFAGNFPWEY